MLRPHTLLPALGCALLLLVAGATPGCDSGDGGTTGTGSGSGSGSGSGGGNDLTCEWLEASNCWKTALAEAKACVIDGSVEQGALDLSTGVCTYTTGETATFAGLSDPLDPFDQVWNVTMTDASGGFCASFVEVEGANESMTLTTASGAVVISPSGSSYDLTCPDGNTWSASQTSLFACDLSHAPGTASSGSESWISLSMIGGGSDATSAVNVSCSSN